jgi:hypothetical protein
LSPETLPAFLLFAALAIALPGAALQGLFRVRVEAALVLPLGTAFCAGAYWLSLVLDLPWLFPILVLLAVASAAGRWTGVTALRPSVAHSGSAGASDSDLRLPGRERAQAATPSAPAEGAGKQLRGIAPPLLALLALLAVTQFPFNRLATDGTGDFLLDPLVTFDSAFHVGLTRELVAGHPPQVPGVAGFPLGYHLGTDLVRAAALRWAGVDPWDALTRLDVALWGLALILALRAAAARLGAPPGCER